MKKAARTGISAFLWALAGATLFACPPAKKGETYVAVPPTDSAACPTLFVDLGGLGEKCGSGPGTKSIPNPCLTGEERLGSVGSAWSSTETTGITNESLADGRYLHFVPGADFCATESRVVEATYTTTSTPGTERTGTLYLLLGPSRGTVVSVASRGHEFAAGGVDGVGHILCAPEGQVQTCGGFLAPGSSAALSSTGVWSVDRACTAQITSTELKFIGDSARPSIDCSVSSDAAVRIVRQNYFGPVSYSVDGQPPVTLAADAFKVPGGSPLRLGAEVSGQPVSWSCVGNAGSELSTTEETLTIENVRSDLTCTVGTACEPPAVTLDATAEDGSPLLDLDVTTPAVIDLDPTTSVLFKVSGDGFEPTSIVTLLVNGGAIDEFVGETTVAMQEILSSDAAYDLQAEVQACGAAVRSPAVQLRRM